MAALYLMRVSLKARATFQTTIEGAQLDRTLWNFAAMI
jgi:hypothetical protein